MPLEWKKGKNPYRQNYFNILQSGPNATPQQIVQKANEQIKEVVKTGSERVLDDVPIDEYIIQEARTKLLDPPTRLEEMLMAHPPALKNQKRIKALFNKLEKISDLPTEQPELLLAHPLGALWFLPPPGPEDFELPEWEEFELGVAGDETDKLLDIVFDI